VRAFRKESGPLQRIIGVAVTVTALLCAPTSGVAQAPPQTTGVQAEVSAAEIERTMRAIDVDRTSGSDGGRASADYLDRKLAGVLQIDATDTLHEDIVTTTWGTPTPESAARLPGIPYITITKSDGDRLLRAAAPPLAATLTTEVTRSWRTIPIVVADVPGRTRDFVLVATHLDAYWHTADDTYDTLDLNALTLDTQYRIAQLYDLATLRVLPHRLEPITAAYVAAAKERGSSAGSAFDLTSTVTLALVLAQAAAQLDRAAPPITDDAAAQFNALVVRLTHRLNSALYTRSGRFDQDPAADLPLLPLLARVKDLAALPHEGDEFGFLETEMIRGRNRVESTMRDAIETIDAYLSQRRLK
jgi:hypothetical protein